jgi:hypothetical protein
MPQNSIITVFILDFDINLLFSASVPNDFDLALHPF